jgi:hypothetical protein
MLTSENKQKIKQVSGILSFVSVLVIVGCASYLIFATYVMGMPIGNPPTSHFTPTYWSDLIAGVIEITVWWNLWSFFNRLRKGHLFDALTVSRLSYAGKIKLAGCFYTIVANLILRHAGSNFFSDEESGLMVSTAIILIAWLLREAQNLEEEQKLTV